MKNYIYTFLLKNEKGEIITSIICDTFKNALFIVTRLAEERYLKIDFPIECIPMEIIDYDC